MKKVLFTAFLTVMYLTGCTQKEMTDLPRGTATPEMTAAVDSFVEATKSRPAPPDSIQLHSIMIVKQGKVVLERWFNGEAVATDRILPGRSLLSLYVHSIGSPASMEIR